MFTLSHSCAIDNEFTKEIRKRYEQFPTLFELTYDSQPSSTFINMVIAKLERERMHEGTEDLVGDVYSLNCLTYFYLWQNRLVKAEHCAAAALVKDPRSVTALANKCELCLHRYEFEAATSAAEALEKLKGHKAEIATAVAGQGYCFSRLGPTAQMKAIEKYSNAIELGRAHCSPDQLMSWRFGMALNLDRVFEADILREYPEFDNNDIFKKAVEVLSHVIHSDNRTFKAKGYLVLGQIIKKKFKNWNRKVYEEARIVEVGDETLTVLECFERACELAPEDRWVLERAGRYWRHVRKFDRALELLQRAYTIFPSTFALHHLGLTHRSLADQAHARSLDAPTAERCRGISGQRHPWRSANAVDLGKDSLGTNKLTPLHCDVSAQFAALSITRGEDGQPDRILGVRQLQLPSWRPRWDMERFSSSKKMLRELPHHRSGAAQDPGHSQARGQERGKGLFNRYSKVTDPEVTKHLDQAIKYITEGIELSQETANHLLVTLAEIFSSLGKTKEADNYFFKSLKAEHYVSKLFCARTLEKWGLDMQERGDQKRSEALLRMAIETAAKVNNTRKVAQYSLIKQLKESRAQTPTILRSCSMLYELVGLHGQALNALWEADKIQPHDPETLHGLVKNLAFRKQYEEALMYWTFLKCTESDDHLIDGDLLESIYFGAAETRVATLPLSSYSICEVYETLLWDRSRDKRMCIFHKIDSNEDIVLAENIQALAKEVSDVEFVNNSEMVAGKPYTYFLKKATEKYNAIVVLVTPDFVADELSTSLCSLLKQCFLLCLRSDSVSDDQIPAALKDCHHASLARALHNEDFTTSTDPIKKLHMWREIFNNLRKAKKSSSSSKQ